MAARTLSAAVSHVGRIRANNQDSGYSGAYLFAVADGMGGHAGGDVASAIAIRRIREVDREFPSAHDAEFALQAALIAANQLITETVFEHQELTGMGTTVSAMIRVGDQIAIAHIGDSRIYRFRDGELKQITADHTFVQRLVDSGRITPEEAAVHPRRSVLMRVLGDVDAAPEVDTAVMDIQPGDRWLLCSDGLSSYLAEERIRHALASEMDANQVTQRLVKETLDHGAPDNVTVVVMDVTEDVPDDVDDAATTVGSAAAPLTFEASTGRKPIRLPTILLHPLKVTTAPEDSHFEPESDQYFAELIAEDRRRRLRRRISWTIALVAAVVVLVGVVFLGYRWTQQHYYVGADGSNVAIFKGVQQGIGPVHLSSVYEDSDLRVGDLPAYTRENVRQTINASSLSDARAIIRRLEAAAESDADGDGTGTPTPTPTPTPTGGAHG
ncbi:MULTISPECIES: Stp1/IreP family PP2C-type Ser/Thr phosphatase [unclassified Curtobacterium]|uniref:Stp1/IreP family PP2C-type Ser/Thr phosphatase n=1 Tax=unclassified Curtobacterium TaxID=257496 RepID=UPI000DA7496C|nr:MULTISPECIES: Stp1/IreP family PP2C-type Ser/Thr phosphatase [unclassified Curtobacterium]PZE77784.1 Stp1/IreP family PP2C-type Ser/Thr phosphatase [Curtobacterium sp. MCBD17_019]WIE54644.1 Stp1/IreP family PP2C-type Ser/Thr phosphatase [Curtobacterium sp. MCBD17_003]